MEDSFGHKVDTSHIEWEPTVLEDTVTVRHWSQIERMTSTEITLAADVCSFDL